MGNCECLQGNEEHQQIDVTRNDYNRDYTSPGNFKGGNKFMLMENSESEENDNNNNKLRFQSYKEATNDHEEEVTYQKVEIVVDDNRVEALEKEDEEEDFKDVVLVSGGTNQNTYTKKNLAASYKINPYKNLVENEKSNSIKKPVHEEKEIHEEPPKAIEDLDEIEGR